MNTREFQTRQEAKAFAGEFKTIGIGIAYRISANYPLTLVRGKEKADRTKKPKNYTLYWN